MSKTVMSTDRDIHVNSLLASTFSHPREVLANPFLDTLQKRCILAAWASDAFAVEGRPWLRQIPGSCEHVRIGDILDALQLLDGDDSPPPPFAPRMSRPGSPIRLKAIGRKHGAALGNAREAPDAVNQHP